MARETYGFESIRRDLKHWSSRSAEHCRATLFLVEKLNLMTFLWNVCCHFRYTDVSRSTVVGIATAVWTGTSNLFEIENELWMWNGVVQTVVTDITVAPRNVFQRLCSSKSWTASHSILFTVNRVRVTSITVEPLVSATGDIRKYHFVLTVQFSKLSSLSSLIIRWKSCRRL